MMMRKIDLYDAAVNEVRGQESDAERQALEADPVAWRNALQSVIDEMDSQFRMRSDLFDDATEFLHESSDEYAQKAAEYQKWKLGARTFKKHIEARLAAVERFAQEDDVTAEDFADLVRVVVDPEVGPREFDEAMDELQSLLDRFERLRRLQ